MCIYRSLAVVECIFPICGPRLYFYYYLFFVHANPKLPIDWFQRNFIKYSPAMKDVNIRALIMKSNKVFKSYGSIYTHFNTLKKKSLGKHCEKR